MPATLPRRASVVAGWLAFVWLSTHWYSWQRTIDLLFGSDMVEYERVARAAPSFPAEPLPSQHAARFAPHYLIGLVSHGLGVGDRAVYYVAAFLLLLAVVAVVDLTIAPLRLELPAYAVCIGALIANPYLFRFLAICPARLADSVFVLGASAALLGLLRSSALLLVGGLVVATLGRSEAVVPLVLLAPLGVLLAPDRRRRRRLVALLALAAPVATYSVIRAVDATFSYNDTPGFMDLTMFGALVDLPGSARAIGSAIARTGVGIAGVAGVVVGVAALRGRCRLAFSFWAPLVAGLAVSLEALVLNPIWLNGSEPLLSALGTALLVVAAARLAASVRIGYAQAAVATGGLALVSLHHRFSSISPVSRPTAYAVLALVGGLLAAVGIWRGSARRHPLARARG